MSNDLFNHFNDATRTMQSEYERIQKRATEDPGTAGDNGEENWAQLLRGWLPSKYHIVTKGRIMDYEGRCGPQVDVLVLSPSYPQSLLSKKEYLAGGVIAAFECKLTLKAEHIRTAVSNAVEIQQLLAPERKGTPFKELHPQILYGLLSHSHIWQGAQSTPIENIIRCLDEAESALVQHPREVLNVICVSNLANWSSKTLIFTGDVVSRLKNMYEQKDCWPIVEQAGGAVETAHFCSATEKQTDKDEHKPFTPIGAFLTSFYAKLAWEDREVRGLAEYFMHANLEGIGEGRTRTWLITNVLSDEVQARLANKDYPYFSDRWHEWSRTF